MNHGNREITGRESSMAAQNESIGRYKCVADVMTRKTVTLSPHHGIAEAVSLMADRHFRHIVVVDTGGQILGVISDRDILRTLARTSNWQTKDVSQIMTREPVTVKRETPLSVAVAKIVAKRINCLPVLDDEGKVCGILTSTDLLKAYQKLLESLEKNRATL
ncbi:MAG TPA: CBS domain-containing protein [Candidatus Binatia bacterium]|nr:CBS domain-containing protein [Candidatus Binatia bacterium]